MGYYIYTALAILAAVVASSQATYNIGVGISDCTGPIVEVTFMGYAQLKQKGEGIHLRQFSRAFIIDDGERRVVFVSVDAGMMGHAVRRDVLANLRERYGDKYTEQNVIISGTHTHGGPGGFLMDLLFDLTSFGFVKETFDSLVTGISQSIYYAHNSLRSGRIYITQGEVLDANINRSPTAYLNNPAEERAQYEHDVDKTMVQMRFVNLRNEVVGVINWFAVHPTSMNNTNHLVTSDNMGYASILLEQKMNPGVLPGKGSVVTAFASSNLGDVSPNIQGPKCEFTGNPCDLVTSTCPKEEGACFSSGPGKDMQESTQIIASRLFERAASLLDENKGREVTGPVKYIHQFVDMPEQTGQYFNPKTKAMDQVRGCLPAMGYSFAAGTTDGPGAFDFTQGTTSDNLLWNLVRDFLATPTKDDIECQSPKPILLATGRVKFPYEWQPKIVPTQLALIGNVALAAVPGEFTTMAGRRLRNAVREAILQAGGEETQVIVAGLSNMYTDYITTPEEYEIQRYEGASTIFGPHTHTLYSLQYQKLAQALIQGTELEAGPSPPRLDDSLISLMTPVVYDSAGLGQDYGDCKLQPHSEYSIGDTVRTKFVAGNPRNNHLLGKTFLTVEKLSDDGKWVVIATDASWETTMKWVRVSSILGTSEVEINWSIGPQVIPGVYRIRHIGYYKYAFGGIYPYDGETKTFTVA